MRPQADARTFSRLLYVFIVLILALLLLISCLFLLSQAVRTSPNHALEKNINALVIGISYIVVFLLSMMFCLKRRLSVRLQLSRIPRKRIAVGNGDVPKSVHLAIEEELLRSCAIAYYTIPKVSHRNGWGSPGTKYEGIRFRTAILDTVPEIDAAARAVIPSMPSYSPHIPIYRHLRHIMPLISADAYGETYFQTYVDAVEQARYSDRELSQDEFEMTMEAKSAIEEILRAYRHILNQQIVGS